MHRVPGPPVRGHIRLAGYRRVSHGLFLPSGENGDDLAEEEWHRELTAWLLVLPKGARFTHLTGARIRRWKLPKVPTTRRSSSRSDAETPGLAGWG